MIGFSFVIWQATGLSNVALEAQCMYLAGGLKNIDLKNWISTKSERFTARTGFDLYPSILLYIYFDMWHVTGDTWHMTGMGRWTFSQNFSSLALTVCELFPQSTLTDWLTDWCRSNPVLAVKRSLFVEIRFLRSIFFRPHVRYMHWASNAMLDRPVASQMTKLEHIKAGK